MAELDIFADIEKSLCDSLGNLNLTRNSERVTSNESSEQSLIDCLENVKDLGRIHGPAVRGKFVMPYYLLFIIYYIKAPK